MLNDAKTPSTHIENLRIAGAFLPSRWHYHYAKSKLLTDPLYTAACAVLANSCAPLLDLGCGIGLLAHCLRVRGIPAPYRGVDNDTAKIALARRAAADLSQVEFSVADLDCELPDHRGSVALLDTLQYLPAGARDALLEHVCGCIADDGALVIRTGLADASWRSLTTYAVDVLSRAVRWMNRGPRQYPTRELLERMCARHGLTMQVQPLWGKTPFNNWLIVARKAG